MRGKEDNSSPAVRSEELQVTVSRFSTISLRSSMRDHLSRVNPLSALLFGVLDLQAESRSGDEYTHQDGDELCVWREG